MQCTIAIVVPVKVMSLLGEQTSGQSNLAKGRIAWAHISGAGKVNVTFDCAKRPANQNVGRQRAGKSRRHFL